MTSEAELLKYLANIGAVFHRPGIFGGRIILDQRWALEAIYAVFERQSSTYAVVSKDGRFSRTLLDQLLWRDMERGPGEPRGFRETEQRLFISMMEQCSICFELKAGDGARNIEPEYIVPDLLPEAAEHTRELVARWAEDPATECNVFEFDILPPGLMRNLMSRVGRHAGVAATYWRDGFSFYDGETGARCIVE